MNLGETIKKRNEESQQDCAKTLIFLRHHLHEDMKNEYHTIPTLSLNSSRLKAFLMKTNAFTLLYYIIFLDENKINNLYYSQYYLFCVY